MFGNQNMQDMMAKLQEMQGAVEDSKKRLENIYVKGDAFDGKLRFIMDGNRQLKEFHLDEDILKKSSVDDFKQEIIEAFNKAIKDADHVNENEMKSTAFNIIPGMGNK
ncbi:MAG: YbaB/EbfC family nucleoid-associated protein [Bacteroidota bacterium]|nr:YbaB/EbfC family nucleoid-associated protein [Bacteroidota bacterium]MEC7954374.1 YbaB/EbfC family nucleoid-associated protein [Bacteroidota bacterium]MEC8285961.1 YbaB/EbfC family nucleoid-associated protein [Bacteroidota bacterium]MEC9231333.1 YbaB/EbfC family nucleoid-associated protein [Bacteroidota bacterium]|tara:strand:- start:14 stop:337 length:324 start_codon:yes stop_codon:yes gene_type:complete